VFGLIFFLLAWHIAVYCPVAHVLWNPQGFLLKHDVQDFAGGTLCTVRVCCDALS
jgi:ammonia channel protein AmtB